LSFGELVEGDGAVFEGSGGVGVFSWVVVCEERRGVFGEPEVGSLLADEFVDGAYRRGGHEGVTGREGERWDWESP